TVFAPSVAPHAAVTTADTLPEEFVMPATTSPAGTVGAVTTRLPAAVSASDTVATAALVVLLPAWRVNAPAAVIDGGVLTPVPLTEMSNGFSFASLFATWIAALRAPTAPGAKRRTNVVDPPTATGLTGGVVTLKSPGFV